MDRVGFEPTTSAILKFYPDIGKPMTHHDDAVKVAPDVYKVLLENDEVRVLEAQLKQGAKSEMHCHARNVAYFLNNSLAKLTFLIARAMLLTSNVVGQCGSMESHTM